MSEMEVMCIRLGPLKRELQEHAMDLSAKQKKRVSASAIIRHLVIAYLEKARSTNANTTRRI